MCIYIYIYTSYTYTYTHTYTITTPCGGEVRHGAYGDLIMISPTMYLSNTNINIKTQHLNVTPLARCFSESSSCFLMKCQGFSEIIAGEIIVKSPSRRCYNMILRGTRSSQPGGRSARSTSLRSGGNCVSD